MLFVGYPRHSASIKTQKWLDDHGSRYTFHIKDELSQFRQKTPYEALVRG